MSMMVSPYRYGGGGPTAYNYHRLYFPDGSAASRLGLREIEYRATVGGADLTGGDTTQRVAAASASNNLSGLYDRNYAFDNNITTGTNRGWATSDSGVGAWIRWSHLSFTGSAKGVAEVAVYSAWASVAGNPLRIVCQGSNDAASWTDLFDTGTISGWGTEQWLRISAAGYSFGY